MHRDPSHRNPSIAGKTQSCILLAALATVLQCSHSAWASESARAFNISGDDFLKDGEPFRILSAEVHSSRAHPSDWGARLAAVASLGVNSVTTYVVWSHHEPQPGAFDFESMPLVRWLQTINSSGLLAIVRVGPYVTAEFDNGGLPYWLATVPGIELRTNQSLWLSYVDRYFDALVPHLLPFMYPAGPIVSMQVEDDTDTEIPAAETEAYYDYLIAGLRRRGVTTLLSTLCGFWSEPNPSSSCERAARPGAWLALEFSDGQADPATVCSDPAFRAYYPTGPCMVMETYTGWIDVVGGSHQCTAGFAPWLAALLAHNLSASVYMGFGGTNFGFEGGSDLSGHALTAVIASYDYNAPVTEAGQTGAVYAALRAIYEAAGQTPPPQPPNASVAAYGTVAMAECAGLWDAVAAGTAFAPSVTLSAPVSMEALAQAYGWILYAVSVPAWRPGAGILCIPQLQDRALVYAEGAWAGLLGWTEAVDRGACVQLPHAPPASEQVSVSILVENAGRCAGEVTDSSCALKGILGGEAAHVTLDGAPVAPPRTSNWTHTLLPMGEGLLPWGSVGALAAALPWEGAADPARCGNAGVQSGARGPVFWRGNLTLGAPASAAAAETAQPASYLQVTGWGHGFAAVNGVNLGRFSCRGPQRALYVPAAALRAGPNEVLVFETDFNDATNCTPGWRGADNSSGSAGARSVEFVAAASWTTEGPGCPA